MSVLGVPLILSPSKGRSRRWWFDKLTMSGLVVVVRQAHHERFGGSAHPEPVEGPVPRLAEFRSRYLLSRPLPQRHSHRGDCPVPEQLNVDFLAHLKLLLK